MASVTVCVGVVVHDAKVLLIKRANPEGDLVYQFPAGKLEVGEDTSTGAVREVLEETGVIVQAYRDLGSRIHPYTNTYLAYRGCEYQGETEVDASTKDAIDEVIWVKIDEIDNYIKTGIFVSVQEYLSAMNIGNDA